MKMAVFWVVAPMMEAASTSETLVNFYQTTLRYNSEDSHILILVLITKSIRERCFNRVTDT
jgi:hypothetical protein